MSEYQLGQLCCIYGAVKVIWQVEGSGGLKRKIENKQ